MVMFAGSMPTVLASWTVGGRPMCWMSERGGESGCEILASVMASGNRMKYHE